MKRILLIAAVAGLGPVAVAQDRPVARPVVRPSVQARAPQTAPRVPSQGVLSREVLDIAEAVPDEGLPRPQRHYPVTNEYRHDILTQRLSGLGGAYVGVGSDQNYTMAALAGSELLWLVDYDPLVPLIHRMYGVLLRTASTPDELIAKFDEAHVAESTAAIRAAYEGELGEKVARYYRDHRGWVHRFLRRMQRAQFEGRAVSWIGDQTLFDRIKRLHAEGRVIARNGDVTAERTVRAVGDAARRLGITVRVIYFSNAEQFFSYSPSFVQNMEGLPTDERSVVVRTIRHRRIPLPEGCPWSYLVHEMPDFIRRIKSPGYRRVFAFSSDLLAFGAPYLGRDGLSVITHEMPLRGTTRSTRQ